MDGKININCWFWIALEELFVSLNVDGVLTTTMTLCDLELRLDESRDCCASGRK